MIMRGRRHFSARASHENNGRKNFIRAPLPRSPREREYLYSVLYRGIALERPPSATHARAGGHRRQCSQLFGLRSTSLTFSPSYLFITRRRFFLICIESKTNASSSPFKPPYSARRAGFATKVFFFFYAHDNNIIIPVSCPAQSSLPSRTSILCFSNVTISL